MTSTVVTFYVVVPPDAGVDTIGIYRRQREAEEAAAKYRSQRRRPCHVVAVQARLPLPQRIKDVVAVTAVPDEAEHDHAG